MLILCHCDTASFFIYTRMMLSECVLLFFFSLYFSLLLVSVDKWISVKDDLSCDCGSSWLMCGFCVCCVPNECKKKLYIYILSLASPITNQLSNATQYALSSEIFTHSAEGVRTKKKLCFCTISKTDLRDEVKLHHLLTLSLVISLPIDRQHRFGLNRLYPKASSLFFFFFAFGNIHEDGSQSAALFWAPSFMSSAS